MCVEPSAAVRYREIRGYRPAHPVSEHVLGQRSLEELEQIYRGLPDSRVCAHLGLRPAPPLSFEQLQAAEIRVAQLRQDVVDLFVLRVRQAGAADGSSCTPPPRAAAAYARLCGGASRAGANTARGEAAVAYAAHAAYCFTPREAVGPAVWSSYLHRSGADPARARAEVASDIYAAFVHDGFEGVGGLADDEAEELAGAVETVVNRWEEDCSPAWESIASAAQPTDRMRFPRGLVRPRHLIATEPFDLYDNQPSQISSGGVYGAEVGVVEALAFSLGELWRRSAQAAAAADALAEQAIDVRAMPNDTLADCTERQWRLVELAEAAERLAEGSGEELDEIEVLAREAPDQLLLFVV